MLLVVDANVLIDFAKADVSVLALVVRHVGPLHVARDVLDEVSQLDEDACARLGVTIVDGTLEQLAEAGAMRGGLSFEDRMCLILARDNGWVCVSNDGKLRRTCGEFGVEVWWGLQLLLDLVAAGALEADAAIDVAEAIGAVNPWIAPAVIDDFKRKALAKEWRP